MFDKKKTDFWMPVDFYTGGAEHACMHLIYARFFTKVLRDFGLVNKNLNEPFKRLFNQGMVHKDGFVMSKSKGNVVLPEEVSDKYGIDTARLFLMSIASPDKDTEWNENGIEGSYRFVNKLFDYFSNVKTGKSDAKIQSKINKAIKEIAYEIENLGYNLAIIKLRALFDYIHDKEISKKDIESFIKILSPFMPHISEEFWEKTGNKGFVCMEKWPRVDESKINEKLDKEEKDVENLIADVLTVAKIIKEKGKSPEKLFIYTIPNEKEIYQNNISLIAKKTNLDIRVFAVNDKNKHDPENKSQKTKPGKPAIYLE